MRLRKSIISRDCLGGEKNNSHAEDVKCPEKVNTENNHQLWVRSWQSPGVNPGGPSAS
jgi:hypothetical protein